MTDNEIIKAWDICLHTNNREDCEICPHSIYGIHCIANLRIDTFNLLKRQQAEIEELQSEITLLKQSNANLQELYQCEKEKVANAKQKVIDIAKALKTAKADAIKEFAERLKAEELEQTEVWNGDDEYDIGYNSAINAVIEKLDRHVKEMVGDTDG